MANGWYILHTYAGYEGKIERTIRSLIERNELSSDVVLDVKVPVEDVCEVKEGKKKVVTKKFLPGYIMVEMNLPDLGWKDVCSTIRRIQGVTGFVGTGAKPIPLHESEVKMLLRQQGMEETRREMDYEVGDNVEILDSSFRGMVGRVSEIDSEKGKVVVMLSLFGGRETPVDLDYDQVFKV